MVAAVRAAPRFAAFLHDQPDDAKRGHRIDPPCGEQQVRDKAYHDDEGEPAARHTLNGIGTHRCWRRFGIGPFRRSNTPLAHADRVRECSGVSRLNLAALGGYAGLDTPSALPFPAITWANLPPPSWTSFKPAGTRCVARSCS